MKIILKVFKLNYKIIVTLIMLVLVATTICVYTNVNASEPNGIKLPIIMYHSILKDKSRSGKYIISPDVFENDLKYIKNHGYNTINMTELIDYVYNNVPLPEKPIIITFDDGHYNNLTYAVPLLEKYNMKAVISIVGKYTDTFTDTNEANTNYSYLRWCDITSLIDTNIIEFQNHTYNLHNNSNSRIGCAKKKNESLEQYKEILSQDICKLQNEFNEHTGYTPNTFTYPFGSISNDSTDILKSLGFKASLSCSSGINYITKDIDCLFLLKRNNRPSYISSEQFFNKILK